MHRVYIYNMRLLPVEFEAVVIIVGLNARPVVSNI